MKTDLSNKEVNKLKILIIDDEGDTCFLLSNILKGEQFEIEHVNTLAQAEVFMREEHPSIIFLDNRLPDGLGINEIESMRMTFPGIRIVVITGSGSLADKKKALQRGADAFLIKPFTGDQIHEVMSNLAETAN